MEFFENDSWIFFSILSALSLSIVSIIDRYVLIKWIKNPLIPIFVLGIMGLIPSLMIYIFHGYTQLSLIHAFLSFVAGFSFLFMAYFYFCAAKIEEISRVVPLFYIAPIFVAILSSIFLHEILSFYKYLGVFFLISGSILISLKKQIKYYLSKALGLMILSTFFYSIHMVITKYLLDFADYWRVFSYIRISIFITLVPIFPRFLPEIKTIIDRHGKKVFGVMAANETMGLAGGFFFTIAASTGYVTLVNALSSLRTFFVFLFTLIIGLFYPLILKEEKGKVKVFLKFMAIVFMFLGVLLMT
jgi:drug/metabolite transporter (DMT)-like permease